MVKNQPVNAGNTTLITGLERSRGEENGNLLLYSGKSMDRGADGLQSMGSQRVRHDSATKQEQC